jgi:cell division septation protein DedD
MRVGGVVLLLALASGAGELAAQAGTGSLAQVEDQIEAHRYTEARQQLTRWWQAAGDTASGDRRAQALHLRAVLAEDLDDAERDLARIVVEHARYPRADAALLRLAQLRFARADSAGGRAFLERLVRDYPQSGLRSRAVAMMGTAPAATPAATAPAATPAATPPAPPGRPPARTTARTPASAPVPAASRGRFTVQVGAFATAERAESVRTSLARQGFEAYLAEPADPRLTAVRVGHFADRAAANAMAQRLRAAGMPTMIVALPGS